MLLQTSTLLLLAYASFTGADLYPKPHPDPAPPGYEQWTSPVVLPSPQVRGTHDWALAVLKSRAFVAQLTLEGKSLPITSVDPTERNDQKRST